MLIKLKQFHVVYRGFIETKKGNSYNNLVTRDQVIRKGGKKNNNKLSMAWIGIALTHFLMKVIKRSYK